MMPLAAFVAFWPVVFWYGRRIFDGSDEPYGVIALAAVLFLVVTSPRRRTNFPAVSCAAILFVYAATYHFVPPMVRALFACQFIAVLASQRLTGSNVHIATAGLCVLSLPIISSLQFYAGYPLRVLVAKGSAALLGFSGHQVAALGTELVWQSGIVEVDAPCSGIRMLWTGLFLALFLAARWKIRNRQTLVLISITLVVVVLGNIIRATTLFYLESGILLLPRIHELRWFYHDGPGLVIFAATATVIAAISRKSCEPQSI